MIEALLEFFQAIVTVVAGIIMFVIFKIVDVFFRIIDWRPRRNRNHEKPPDFH